MLGHCRQSSKIRITFIVKNLSVIRIDQEDIAGELRRLEIAIDTRRPAALGCRADDGNGARREKILNRLARELGCCHINSFFMEFFPLCHSIRVTARWNSCQTLVVGKLNLDLRSWSLTTGQLNSRENMPAMGRQVYRGWLSNSELRVSGEFCKQGYAVNFDLKQSSVTEIVLAGDVSRQA